MDKSKQLLQEIQSFINEAGLNAACLPVDDPSGEERLVVYGGKDAQERLQLIEISVSGASGAEKSKGIKESEFEPSLRIQIDALFPFPVADIALADVAQFLHFINLQVELPGFYLDHLNDRILYRYVHLTDGEKPPKKMLLAIIGIALFLQDVFGETFARLASGKTTFPNLMEEIKKTLS